MNNKRNNKGFTLIELLAVIVILAILVMLAIPAVTRYLTTARAGAFADNAQKAIDAVRTDVTTTGFTTSSGNCYDIPASGEGADAKPARIMCIYMLENDDYTTAGVKAVQTTNAKRSSINEMLEKKMLTSPFGGNYEHHSYILATQTYTSSSTTYTYEMCLTDLAHNGFGLTEEKLIDSKTVTVGGASQCEIPSELQAPTSP